MPIERGSTTHGPHQDDQMRQEVQGRIQGSESPRVEDWHEPEPAGEDQPEPDRLPGGHTEPGSPAGMTSHDVAGRSRIARYVSYKIFPADRARMLAAAADQNAPDDVIAQLRKVPSHRTYQSVNQVWEALGHATEDESHRA